MSEATRYAVHRCMATGKKFVVISEMNDTDVPNLKVCLLIKHMGKPCATLIHALRSSIEDHTLDANESIKEEDLIEKCIKAVTSPWCYLREYTHRKDHCIAFLIKLLTVDRPAANAYGSRYNEILYLYGLYQTKFRHPQLDAYLADLVAKEIDDRYRNCNAKKIQTVFRSAIANPATPICRSRLLREYTELSS